MKIDYSLPESSKNFIYADIGVRHGYRHICLSLSGDRLGISTIEKIAHFVLGILKMIPIFGYLLTAFDKLIQPSHIRTLKIESKDPFTQGLEHGRTFKRQIQNLYQIILASKGGDSYLRNKATEFERNIPKTLIHEMKGLSQGAQVPYDDVLLIHTFLDAQPGSYGCSAVAKTEDERIAAANHAIRNERFGGESIERRQKLLQTTLKESEPVHTLLKASNVTDTIQSIFFNTNQKSIHLSATEKNAAEGRIRTFRSSELFGKPLQKGAGRSMQLLRNLDWPWYFLGQNTLLLTKEIHGKKVVNVTFPGYLGSLSGMNEDGLCLAACTRSGWVHTNGMPKTLLFSELLGKCSSVDEAEEYLQRQPHGSSMNLVIADEQEALN